MKVAKVLGVIVLFALASGAPALAGQLETYTVTPAFSPYATSGRTVTIKGVGFTASSTVSFGGTVVTPIFIDTRTLVAVVPTVASAQIVTITVSDPANGSDSYYPFLYTNPVIYVATTGSDSNNGTSPSTPKLTLGAAMAAASGTTPTEIRVSAGYYPEAQLSLLHASVLSCGWAPGFGLRDPDGYVTEIDGHSGGFVIRTSGLQNVSVIDGCTIENGLRDGFGGGGIDISADSCVVNGNVLVGNRSTIMGGAAYFTASTLYGGKPTFSNNIMVGNRAYAKSGGGIVVYPDYNSQQPVKVGITANQIVGNRSLNGSGGGISFTSASYGGYNSIDMRVTDNVVAYNRAKGGAGIEATLLSFGDYLNIEVGNNLIARNVSTGGGGGLSFQGFGVLDGSVTGNTIAENTAAYSLGGGLGINWSLNLVPSFTASDLILWGNAGGDTTGQAVGAVTYSDSGDVLGGPGDISADPEFTTGPFGDFYLTQNDPNLPDSPAVDAGDGPASGRSLETLTTRTDSVADAGIVDLGYHALPSPGDSTATVTLTRVDPPAGDLHGNDWVLVRGDGFDPGAVVSFDGVPATHQIYVGHRRILAQPAPHVPTRVHVRVTNPDTTFAQLSYAYLYFDNEPPVWQSTVGVVSATSGIDACQRSVEVDWNPAVDADSMPVVYEVYRVQCVVSTGTTVPCDNFGYIPNATNFLGTTTNTFYVDTAFSSTGQDQEWIYNVRARDSEPLGTNKEWNFAKKVVTASAGTTEVPPSPVGDTLGYVPGSSDTLTWNAANGAVAYGVYRETDASTYASPGSLTKLITLDPTNNDADGDGVTDTTWQDTTVPAIGSIFFYKLTALDPCGTETTSEL